MQIIPRFLRAVKLPAVSQHHSPNYSTRGGASIRNIVIHDTEGAYGSAVSWFATSKSAVSAHLVLREDGAEVTQCVPFRFKAWHCCDFNPQSIGIECAGYAGKLGSAQIQSLARITAYLCKKYDIPVRLVKANGRTLIPGITCHQFLGAAGGGHTDPGWSDAGAEAFVSLVKAQMRRGHFRRKWGVA